jgi:hypothetical protein
MWCAIARHVDGAGRRAQAFELDSENTFSFLPGPMAGVACPACFRDILLKDVIEDGECNSCGAVLELTLTATPTED